MGLSGNATKVLIVYLDHFQFQATLNFRHQTEPIGRHTKCSILCCFNLNFIALQNHFMFLRVLACTHPELSGFITTLTVRNMEVANFCAAMDALIG